MRRKPQQGDQRETISVYFWGLKDRQKILDELPGDVAKMGRKYDPQKVEIRERRDADGNVSGWIEYPLTKWVPPRR